MRRLVLGLAAVLAMGVFQTWAQDPQNQPQLNVRANAPHELRDTTPKPASSADTDKTDAVCTVAAGTRVPLVMKQGVTTKNARPGDPVYAQTAFPVAQNNHIVIPAGTFVQGVVQRVVRPGRVKGRAELQMSFTSLIFPNGYTILLPGAVQGTPGSQNEQMKGDEGTIQGPGNKGKDVGTVVGTAIPGAGIGAIASGAKGAAVGGLAGGALGLASVLLTRGPEVQLGIGDSVEMVIERNIDIDKSKVNRSDQ